MPRKNFTGGFNFRSEKQRPLIARQPPPLEADEQRALFDWRYYNRNLHPALKWLHAVPNGLFARSKRTAADAVRQGLTAGVADCFLPYPSKGYNGLYLELKRAGNKQTDEQQQFEAYVRSVGYDYALCYSSKTAIDVILTYLEVAK